MSEHKSGQEIESTGEGLAAQLSEVKQDQTPQITVFRKPIDQLPPIDNESREGDEFWAQRRLRPGGEEDNYHNMPVLGFGIDYDEGEAVLSVPSLDYVNTVVDTYNPGGFTFIEVGAGLGDADSFLSMISNKQFPASDNKDVLYFGVPDEFVEFTNFFEDPDGEQYLAEDGTPIKTMRSTIYDPHYSKTERISLYEHDRVDHLGIIALPANEADKIAKAAEYARSAEGYGGPDFNTRAMIVGRLDRHLDGLSAYSLVKHDSNDIEIQNYKDYLWATLVKEAAYLDRLLAEDIMKKPEYRDFTREELMAEFYKQDVSFSIDRETFDANIAHMQALTPPS